MIFNLLQLGRGRTFLFFLFSLLSPLSELMILSDQKKEFDWSSYGLLQRDWNGTSVGSRDILTGKYSGEEDVVREGD